ncbi:hypothetical protein COB21_03715 [Candidatus Aerophobetes bacterium]|uniref:Uncharacterized protein n=1 Tax=Aerophobetes bacterium TaxID=2030807 RepID=A0A2A4X362_UNCAE|nr:MAG: hypothetical protein COB21_03715 [Candidatus Aerophobetes bacterium]
MAPSSQRVVLSSQFDTLVLKLANQLQSSHHLFAKHVICLPDLKWKKRVIDGVLSIQKVPVISGTSFKELSKVLFSIVGEALHRPVRMPPKDLLALHILSKLEAGFEGFDPLKDHAQNHTYFKALAYKLADAFISFGKYGAEHIKPFLEKDAPESRLFKILFQTWDYPYKYLNDLSGLKTSPFHLHLFNFSFIPPVYRSIIEQLPSTVEVTYYNFSYCNAFWTDILSDDQVLNVQEKAFDQGALLAPIKELQRYMLDRNPLLANFGKLHLATRKVIEQSLSIEIDEAQLSLEKTTLHQVQESILANSQIDTDFIAKDHSLTCSKCVSKRDEVVHARGLIEQVLQRNPYLKLQDISLYAPDMSLYAPFIGEVFNQGSPISHAFFDEKLVSTSAFFACVSKLFSLFRNPITHTTLFDFFSMPFILKAFKWSLEEVTDFSKLFEEANFVAEIEQCTASPDLQTFKAATQRLVLSALFLPSKKPLFPMPFIGKCILEKVASFAHIVMLFSKQAVQFFQKKHTITSFQKDFFDLLSLFVDWEEIGSEGSQLKKRVDLLGQLEEEFGDKCFAVEVFADYVLQSFAAEKSSSLEAGLNVVVCRDLNISTLYPGKVSFALGLNQDDFPRIKSSDNFQTMQAGDLAPSPTEEDRAVFLSLLMQTSQNLHLSYSSYCEKEGVELFPSPLLTALSEAGGQALLIEEITFETNSLRMHPVGNFLHQWQTRSCSIKAIKQGQLELKLDTLKQFSSHPVRHFFRFMGVFLPFKQRDKEERSTFKVRKQHKDQNSESQWQETFAQAHSHGYLPGGSYLKMVQSAFKEERNLFLQGLKALGTSPSEVFCYKFDAAATKFAMEEEHTLHGPLLKFRLGEEGPYMACEGSFSHVCAKGLVLNSALTLENIVKHAGEICTFLMLDVNPHFEKKVWFLDGEKVSFIEKEKESLIPFFLYFLEQRDKWFPLLPRFAPFFAKRDLYGLKKAFEKELSGRLDPYLNHGLIEVGDICLESVMEKGHAIITEIFNPVYKDG